jgi:hypothetical protein
VFIVIVHRGVLGWAEKSTGLSRKKDSNCAIFNTWIEKCCCILMRRKLYLQVISLAYTYFGSVFNRFAVEREDSEPVPRLDATDVTQRAHDVPSEERGVQIDDSFVLVPFNFT